MASADLDLLEDGIALVSLPSLATGMVPNLPGLDQVAYLMNSSMMGVDFLPWHLVVVGGRLCGVEFAQMYRRFGSEVTVVEMGPRLVHPRMPASRRR
jgi:pyruvate/2-oxoglutarate dehydrogenase complex dihydrolipoamide dehydrogenase (E3) component